MEALLRRKEKGKLGEGGGTTCILSTKSPCESEVSMTCEEK